MELEEGSRKRARTSEGGSGCSAGGPDRLSSLPDCLLHTIMASLKARQAVQTCVLSTRWRHLWRSVPCLNIDFDEFKNTTPASDDKSGSSGRRDNPVYIGDDSSGSDGNILHSGKHRSSDSDRSNAGAPVYFAMDNHHKEWEYFTKYKDWEDFEDFAVNLMRRCNIAQLDSLQLRVVDRNRAPEFSNRQAAGWLRRAMKYCTPDCASQHVGLSSGSWRLKRLNLCHLLLDSGFMKLVSSVCRSLEDLELDDCSGKIQSVSSHSLKTLVLKNCRWRSLSEITSPTLETLVIDGGSNTYAGMLVILAPAVAYLHLALHLYFFSGGVSINEVPSIAKASVRLHDHKRSYLYGDQFKLLCSVSNSTDLELSGVGTTVLGKDPRFQEFKNLRNLLLDNCDLSDSFKTLVFFLRGSPNLEKLTLRLCQFPEYPKMKKGPPKLNKSSGLSRWVPARQRLVTKPGVRRMSGVAPCARQPSPDLRGLDLLCENLKVEIIYNKYGDGTLLMQQLLHVSVNLRKDNIKLTKVD